MTWNSSSLHSTMTGQKKSEVKVNKTAIARKKRVIFPCKIFLLLAAEFVTLCQTVEQFVFANENADFCITLQKMNLHKLWNGSSNKLLNVLANCYIDIFFCKHLMANSTLLLTKFFKHTKTNPSFAILSQAEIPNLTWIPQSKQETFFKHTLTQNVFPPCFF